MPVVGVGAAKTWPKILSRMKHRFPANWEMSCLRCDLPAWAIAQNEPLTKYVETGCGRLAVSTGRSNRSRWCTKCSGRNSAQQLSPDPQCGWPALSEWRSVETRTTPVRSGWHVKCSFARMGCLLLPLSPSEFARCGVNCTTHRNLEPTAQVFRGNFPATQNNPFLCERLDPRPTQMLMLSYSRFYWGGTYGRQ